jgi:tetratricopeptide (TPR) repeat protein
MGRRRLRAKKSLIHRFLVWGGFKRGKHLAGSRRRVLLKVKEREREESSGTSAKSFTPRRKPERRRWLPRLGRVTGSISVLIFIIGSGAKGLAKLIIWPQQLIKKGVFASWEKIRKIKVGFRAQRRIRREARRLVSSDEELSEWLKSLSEESFNLSVVEAESIREKKPVALTVAGQSKRVDSNKKVGDVMSEADNERKIHSNTEADSQPESKPQVELEGNTETPDFNGMLGDSGQEEKQTQVQVPMSSEKASFGEKVRLGGRKAKEAQGVKSESPFLSRKAPSFDRFLSIAVKIATVLLILVAISFAGYYMFNKYKVTKESVAVNRLEPTIADLVRQKPRDPFLRIALGETYLARGQNKKAAHQFKQALKIESENQRAIVDLGIAYMRMDKDEEALKWFNKELRLTEDTDFQNMNDFREQALFYSAVVLHKMGRLDEAIKNLKEALVIRRASSDTYFLLGRAYLDKREYAEAIKYFKQTLRLDPKFSDAFYGMGLAYEGLKQKEAAKDAYRKALEITPNFKEAREALDRLEI